MHLFELRPNSSLTPRSAAVFFGSLGAVCLGIASGFAALGLWPILPFAGLEVAALAAAVVVTVRRGRVREQIIVDDDAVVVRRTGPGRPGQALPAVRETRFLRRWTRVEWQRPGNAHWPCRLLLRSGQRAVEVGAFLAESERRGLRDRLLQVIPGTPADGHADGGSATIRPALPADDPRAGADRIESQQ